MGEWAAGIVRGFSDRSGAAATARHFGWRASPRRSAASGKWSTSGLSISVLGYWKVQSSCGRHGVVSEPRRNSDSFRGQGLESVGVERMSGATWMDAVDMIADNIRGIPSDTVRYVDCFMVPTVSHPGASLGLRSGLQCA